MNIHSDADAILECENQAGYCVVPDMHDPSASERTLFGMEQFVPHNEDGP